MLKRVDVTAKTFFAIAAPGSCFAGTLLELALASDHIYMKEEDGVAMRVSPMNAGALSDGQRAHVCNRDFSASERVARVETQGAIDTQSASKLGLATFARRHGVGTTRSASRSKSARRCHPTR